MDPVPEILDNNNKEDKVLVVDLVGIGEEEEVEEKAKLVEEEIEEGRLGSNSKDDDLIKHTNKITKNYQITKELSIKFARSLATLLLRVGSGLCRQELLIHLDEDQHRPEVEIEVYAGQAMVHKEDKVDSSLRWL